MHDYKLRTWKYRNEKWDQHSTHNPLNILFTSCIIMKTIALLTIYFRYCLHFQLSIKTFQVWHIITLNVHTNFASLTNFHHHLECAQQLCKLYVCVQIHITKGKVWSLVFALHSLHFIFFAIFHLFSLIMHIFFFALSPCLWLFSRNPSIKNIYQVFS
jgi:hypothetical protein